MTATADMILERRRTRRKLAIWRIVAVIAVLIALFAFIPATEISQRGPHVARIEVGGVIVDDRRRTQTLQKIAENENVRAVLVDIASPGGTVVGSEAIFESLRRIAERKPVVAVVGEVAASGGYIAAMGADHIVSRGNSITGSIGVISQIPNVTDLLESIGVSVEEIRSAPLKAAPSPVTETSPEALEAVEDIVEDSYAWFRGLVSDRRGLEGTALETVSDGRVFTGRQALELGLVDTLGSEREARDWLAETHDVSRDLEIRTYDWRPRDLPFPLDRIEDAALRYLPFAPAGGVQLAPGPRLMALWTG